MIKDIAIAQLIQTYGDPEGQQLVEKLSHLAESDRPALKAALLKLAGDLFYQFRTTEEGRYKEVIEALGYVAPELEEILDTDEKKGRFQLDRIRSHLVKLEPALNPLIKEIQMGSNHIVFYPIPTQKGRQFLATMVASLLDPRNVDYLDVYKDLGFSVHDADGITKERTFSVVLDHAGYSYSFDHLNHGNRPDTLEHMHPQAGGGFHTHLYYHGQFSGVLSLYALLNFVYKSLDPEDAVAVEKYERDMVWMLNQYSKHIALIIDKILPDQKAALAQLDAEKKRLLSLLDVAPLDPEQQAVLEKIDRCKHIIPELVNLISHAAQTDLLSDEFKLELVGDGVMRMLAGAESRDLLIGDIYYALNHILPAGAMSFRQIVIGYLYDLATYKSKRHVMLAWTPIADGTEVVPLVRPDSIQYLFQLASCLARDDVEPQIAQVEDLLSQYDTKVRLLSEVEQKMVDSDDRDLDLSQQKLRLTEELSFIKRQLMKVRELMQIEIAAHGSDAAHVRMIAKIEKRLPVAGLLSLVGVDPEAMEVNRRATLERLRAQEAKAGAIPAGVDRELKGFQERVSLHATSRGRSVGDVFAFSRIDPTVDPVVQAVVRADTVEAAKLAGSSYGVKGGPSELHKRMARYVLKKDFLRFTRDGMSVGEIPTEIWSEVVAPSMVHRTVKAEEEDEVEVVVSTDNILASVQPGAKINFLDILRTAGDTDHPEVVVPASPDTQYETLKVGAKWFDASQVVAHASDDASVFGPMGVFELEAGVKEMSVPIYDAATTSDAFLESFGLSLFPVDQEQLYEGGIGVPDLLINEYNYGNGYIPKFVLNPNIGGGLNVEMHDFPHYFMPIKKLPGAKMQDGLILGRKNLDGFYEFAAFSLPTGYVARINSGVIHNDAFFKGRYATALSSYAPADVVVLLQEGQKDLVQVSQAPGRIQALAPALEDGTDDEAAVVDLETLRSKAGAAATALKLPIEPTIWSRATTAVDGPAATDKARVQGELGLVSNPV
jgi:hypothetical protein